MANKQQATVRSFAREKDGTTTPGDQVAIQGGLPGVFAYLAEEVDWLAFERGLPEVESAGFRADLATGASVIIFAKVGGPK